MTDKKKIEVCLSPALYKEYENEDAIFTSITRNEVMQYFDYEVHEALTNADYLHDNGFFIGELHIF